MSRFGKDRCLLSTIKDNTGKVLVVLYDSIRSIEPCQGYTKLEISTASGFQYISKEDGEKLKDACLGILPTEEIV